MTIDERLDRLERLVAYGHPWPFTSANVASSWDRGDEFRRLIAELRAELLVDA